MNNIVNYIMMNMLSIFVLVFMVLVGVAFLTLMERKVLSYIQYRKGPNKVGLLGLLQPFSDAIKLFNKEVFIVHKSNYMFYYLSPLFSFFLMMMMWLTFWVYTNIYYMNYSMLFMIVLMSLLSYILLFMGWSSNSVYSMMGSLRLVAQMLSYEVSFMLILMVFMILSESYSFSDLLSWQLYVWNMWFLLPLFLIFFVSILAELNRSPLDFIEGESELVSGFNIEYFSGSFAMIFLAEYGMIIFFSMILSYLFIGVSSMSFIMFGFINMFVYMIIYMRGLLPRMRYDYLMNLCWKIFLPLILNYLLFIMGFKYIIVLLN